MCIIGFIQPTILRKFLLCLHHVKYNVMKSQHGLQSDTAVRFGLCYNVHSAWVRFGFSRHIDTSSIIKAIAPSWPKYSGNIDYPVGSPNECSALYHHTRAITGTENMWVGEYGKLRMEFLDFCITTVQEAVNTVQETINESPTVDQFIPHLRLRVSLDGSYVWNEDEIAN